MRHLLRNQLRRLAPLAYLPKLLLGRSRYLLPIGTRFRGAYPSRAQALAAVPPKIKTGYNHAEIVEISFEYMCQVLPWDYPILFWLQRLLPEAKQILDAGGHMGTKYRAFSRYLDLKNSVNWTVYDVPAIVRAGRQRALKDGLTELRFVDDLSEVVPPDLVLASGLLQYLDIRLTEFLRRLPALPRHLLINKVALRDGRSLVTLEDFGKARVPYQIRNRSEFLAECHDLGYQILDEWHIPELAHVIGTHPELGKSTSRGFYMRLQDSTRNASSPLRSSVETDFS